MARPRTATKLLELRGAFKDHPERKRESEPIPESKFVSTPPKHLSTSQKACWTEIVGMVPAGVLTGADVLHLEIVACLLAEYREAHGDIPTARIARLTLELGKLGLNPSARAALSIEKPRAKNKFDDL